MSIPLLALRVDASASVGMGHLMRCLALTQAWQANGGNATFISYCESDVLRQRIESGGIDLIPLDKPHPDPSDLRTTLGTLEGTNCWLALDGYHFDATYQQAVRSAGHRLLVIDDYAHLPRYHADVLLDQNINAECLTYQTNPEARLLLGNRYVLLRSEFLAWRGWRREIPNVARKLLITLGGSDPTNTTLKIIRAIQNVDVAEVEAKVVIGADNPHYNELQLAAKHSHVPMQLVREAKAMSELMAWADVAVSAGGTTCWELAFMGLPNVVLVMAENQGPNAIGLQEAGAAVNLGWFTEADEAMVSKVLNELAYDPGRRAAMSEGGRRLVDGLGSARVADTLVTLVEQGMGIGQ